MRLPGALLHLLVGTFCVFLFSGCGKGYQLDYGDSAAHFKEADVLIKAKSHLGNMITVRGVVTRQDFSDPENPMIYLGHGIGCNFGRLKSMAAQYKMGETITVNGILERCEAGDILLSPTIGRDPQAEFNPVD